MKLEDLRVPAVSTAGAAFGLSVSEFISEFAARASGQTKWKKFGVKAAIKFVLALIFYGCASKAAGLLSLGFELATYGSLGSIIPDAFMAWSPGGLIGMSEKMAVKVRGAARAAGEIESELAEIEAAAATSRM